MPFDFDLDETAETEPATPTQVEQDAAVDEFLEEEEKFDSQLSEVEKRLEKAQYYRALLTQEIFEGDYSASATTIVDEIRSFIRGRLSVLLGVTQETALAAKVKPPFEADEIKILKQVAAKLLKKPSIMEPPVQPTLKRTQAPVGPVVQMSKPVTPQVKRAPVRPSDLKHPAPAIGKKQPAKSKPTEDFLIIETPMKDGSVTKVKYQKFTDPKHGIVYADKEGKRYALHTNDLGEKIMQSVTTQSRPSTGGVQPFPPLTGAQLSSVSAQQAAETIKKMPTGLATAINESLKE